MDYETALEVFFHPSPAGTPTPYPVANASSARRLRDACEPLATHAIWSRKTYERLAELGLDFFSAYVWGRAAALGVPPVTLVVAAFAAFEPGWITTNYEEAHRRVDRNQLLKVRDEATISSLEHILGTADVSFAVAALQRGLVAADGTGRALFAGLQSRPWPDSPIGQLWRACDLVREHRGDSHIAAYITAGLGPVAMNVLTELYVGMPLGSYTATRGWSSEIIAATIERLQTDGLLADGALTADGLRLREEIEEHTDAMEQPLVEAIGHDCDMLVEQLNGWSEQCIEEKAFPPNMLKRAAG